MYLVLFFKTNLLSCSLLLLYGIWIHALLKMYTQHVQQPSCFVKAFEMWHGLHGKTHFVRHILITLCY